jgi:hypothetical protein
MKTVIEKLKNIIKFIHRARLKIAEKQREHEAILQNDTDPIKVNKKKLIFWNKISFEKYPIRKEAYEERTLIARIRTIQDIQYVESNKPMTFINENTRSCFSFDATDKINDEKMATPRKKGIAPA